MMDDSKQRLGRGLSALLGDDGEEFAEVERDRDSRSVPVELLRPSKYQPRHRFDEEEMASLVESVREKGVLQPILVRRHREAINHYEIVAGERRWRAAQQAQLHEVPVIIKDLSDQDSLQISLIENLQRENLTPIEEAKAYQRLVDEFTHTQDELAHAVGKSRSHVANTLRLLTLPEVVQDLVDSGQLTAGHARPLVNMSEPEAVARKIISKRLSVREAERLVQRMKGGESRRRRAVPAKDADTIALERDLSNILGLKCSIQFHGGGGSLTINYQTLEQLDDVLHRLYHVGHAETVDTSSADDRSARTDSEPGNTNGVSQDPNNNLNEVDIPEPPPVERRG